MPVQVLDYSLTNFKVPGLAQYTPPFGTKKTDGSGLTTTEITRNEMMPFMKQRSISGISAIAGNDPPMGVIGVDSIAMPIEFDANFAVAAGVQLQLDDPSFEGQVVKVVASFETGNPAIITLGVAGIPEVVVLTGNETLLLFAVNGKWIRFQSGGGRDIALPFFAHSSPFLIAGNNRKLIMKAGTKITVGSGSDSRIFFIEQDTELDVASLLDTGNLVNGKDYYIFLCPDPAGYGVVIRISQTKTAPQGFNSDDVVVIGGFHTLCSDVGTDLTYVLGGETLDHPLNGYLAGDILPYSVWCLNHRPFSEPEGMVYIPSLDFWCDIYLQSGSGINTKSVYQGAITRSRQYVDFVEDQFCIKKELLDDGEFSAAMLGSNEKTSVSGASEAGATTGGAGGRKDTANRRMISIYGVEEGCGSLWQWLRTTTAGGMVGAIYGQTADTPAYGTITMTTSAHGPYGQSGGKGSFWGLAGALLAGGSWDYAAHCGSRSRSAADARSHAGAGIGGRGRSHSMRLAIAR